MFSSFIYIDPLIVIVNEHQFISKHNKYSAAITRQGCGLIFLKMVEVENTVGCLGVHNF